VAFGIKTPIETLIELVYVLHDELTDPSAEILDIGCGVPCLVSGMSFLCKKMIYCSETE
jgi:predicted RNA methylase